MTYHDARDFRLFAESFIYGIHTIHTDMDSVLHVYVGLAQARPNKQEMLMCTQKQWSGTENVITFLHFILVFHMSTAPPLAGPQ